MTKFLEEKKWCPKCGKYQHARKDDDEKTRCVICGQVLNMLREIVGDNRDDEELTD